MTTKMDGAHSAMLDDALQRACALTGDLLVRLEVIVSGLVVDPVRMRANLDLTGGMISSEAVMLGLGRAIGLQIAHEVVYDAARVEGTTFTEAIKRDPRVTAHLDAATIDRLPGPGPPYWPVSRYRPRGGAAGARDSRRHHGGPIATGPVRAARLCHTDTPRLNRPDSGCG